MPWMNKLATFPEFTFRSWTPWTFLTLSYRIRIVHLRPNRDRCWMASLWINITHVFPVWYRSSAEDLRKCFHQYPPVFRIHRTPWTQMLKDSKLSNFIALAHAWQHITKVLHFTNIQIILNNHMWLGHLVW